MGTANVDSRRVLVVEDNEDVAAALTFGIEHHGHQVRRARDGLSALEAASQFRPHIALIDLYLPVIDGWQLARMLGDFEVFQRPRLIALSGHAGPADRLRSVLSGFERHLVKPIDLAELQRLIVRA